MSVLRQDTAAPFRAFVCFVGAALFGEECGAKDCVVGDSLHALVAKTHRFVGVKINIEHVEHVLQAAQSQSQPADGACWSVWCPRWGSS